MTDPDITDKRASMLARLNGGMDGLQAWCDTLDDHPRLKFGAEFLKRMGAGEGGAERLRQFAQWAIHPINGVLPPNQSVRPLPPEIAEGFYMCALWINAECEKIEEAPRTRSLLRIGNVASVTFVPSDDEHAPGRKFRLSIGDLAGQQPNVYQSGMPSYYPHHPVTVDLLTLRVAEALEAFLLSDMSLPKPVSHVPAQVNERSLMLDRLAERMDDVALQAEAIYSRSAEHNQSLSGRDADTAKGALALHMIYDRLGPDGLRDFTKWAVHPLSGFFAQHTAVKPLPPEIQHCMEAVVWMTGYRFRPEVTVDSLARDATRLLERWLAPETMPWIASEEEVRALEKEPRKREPLYDKLAADYGKIQSLYTEPLVFKGKNRGVGLLVKTLLKRVHEKSGEEGVHELLRWTDSLPPVLPAEFNEWQWKKLNPPAHVREMIEQLVEDWNNHIAYPEQKEFIQLARQKDGEIDRRQGIAVALTGLTGAMFGGFHMRQNAAPGQEGWATAKGAVVGGGVGATVADVVTGWERKMRYHRSVTWINVHDRIDSRRALQALTGWLGQFAEGTLPEQTGAQAEQGAVPAVAMQK